MWEKALNRLEFNKVRERLAQRTLSVLGEEVALSLEPSLNYEVFKRDQEETHEAVELLRLYPDLPWQRIPDVRPSIKRLGIGGVLNPEELLEIASVFRASRRFKNFFDDLKQEFPILENQAFRLFAAKDLEDKISKSIGPGGEVLDEASTELADIRRALKRHQGQIKEKLDGILRSTHYQKMLQENLVTIRGDRYVIPLKLEYRGQFPGVIHDQSASGQTLYVEPMAVFEINNEVRRLVSREKEEIARILRDLSSRIIGVIEPLQIALDALTRLDFAIAKGRLAYDMNAVKPDLNTRGYINIISGRHPLIPGKVVPVTIHLGGDFSTLVITGPNTGGKTVTLKTVGLFVAMTQAGLHIPAEVGSEIGYYRQIFTDIGDEQSIEQSLSTFSGHMTNIIGILEKADSQSLVLMDEVGAGTDPTEGAALATAILQELHSRGVKTIATTHYSQLKTFAYAYEGVENASVEFDLETLRPTYRLLIGQPGRSNAFEIAQRLGLEVRLVERARELLSEEEREVAGLIESLETSQKAAEVERREAEEIKREMALLKSEYEAMQDSIEAKKEKILAKAHEEAKQLVLEARREADEIISKLKEELTEARNAQGLQKAQHARGALRNLQGKHEPELLADRTQGVGKAVNSVKAGQEVFVPKLNQRAIVLSDSQGKEVQIQVGIMKLSMPLKDLRVLQEEPAKLIQKSGAGSLMKNKALSVPRELDLRGLTIDEAMIEVDKYLDDAYLAGLPQAFLIHGKGTGALRKGITEALAKHPRIKSYRLGHSNEGGMGVTVVEFPQ